MGDVWGVPKFGCERIVHERLGGSGRQPCGAVRDVRVEQHRVFGTVRHLAVAEKQVAIVETRAGTWNALVQTNRFAAPIQRASVGPNTPVRLRTRILPL